MSQTLVIGDIHGWLDKLIALLEQHDLIDSAGDWHAANTTLVFVGDYVDRGPDGIGVIDLIMKLQAQAPKHNGRVIPLLGNHDVLFLAAHLFGRKHRTFYDGWLNNGGENTDMNRITAAHVDWLMSLPAMIVLDETLFLHADSVLYTSYALTLESVNRIFASILRSQHVPTWHKVLDDFSEHGAFLRLRPEYLQLFLATYGVKRMIHGHTPIFRITETEADSVTEPYIYGDGTCINVDHCLYAGGNGFIYRVPPHKSP